MGSARLASAEVLTPEMILHPHTQSGAFIQFWEEFFLEMFEHDPLWMRPII